MIALMINPHTFNCDTDQVPTKQPGTTGQVTWRRNSTAAEESELVDTSGRTSGYQKLVPMFPWIGNCANCLEVTKRDNILEMEAPHSMTEREITKWECR
jgi:hypothetical protein